MLQEEYLPRQWVSPEGNYIGGEWREPADDMWLDSLNPATGELIGRVPASTEVDVDIAVDRARAALDDLGWKATSPSDRGLMLLRLAHLVEEHQESLSRLETLDSGKPIREARFDIAGVVDTLRYFAGAANKIAGLTIDLPDGQLGLVLREPVGVVGAITPWNFPLYVAVWKIAPALAAGNAVVLKPSELASLSCLALGRLASEAEIPGGILNIVTGEGLPSGRHLAGHPDIDMLTFTGSTSTGADVMGQRARRGRPVQLELGGKSPNVIFEDADLDKAIAGAAFGGFYAQGENCNAGSRILVEHSVKERVVAELIDRANRIRVALPTDERAELGAIISRRQLTKIRDFVEEARRQGVVVSAGGAILDEPPFDRGFFFAPTVLTDVTPEHTVFNEEIFGPVITVTEFTDEEEAIQLANSTEFGLAAGIWTSDVSRAVRCAKRIKSGYVWVNTYNTTPVEAPFGGVKGSGFGRDTAMQALDNYLSWKTVAVAVEPFEDWYAEA